MSLLAEQQAHLVIKLKALAKRSRLLTDSMLYRLNYSLYGLNQEMKGDGAFHQLIQP